ncbi:MAG: acyl-[ACP]--phospholipid O-acyltransferase [Geminicoccaceae bacterium]
MKTSLLGGGRFAGLFWTQFMGAMNDNFFKNALVILILYDLMKGPEGEKLVTIAAGLFILPFFLFSATAGQLADRHDKAWLTRMIKVGEIIIMIGGVAGFLLGNVTLLMALLFLMGTQSTLFGPIKYGIIPDLVDENDLMNANGLIEGGTFLAILIGTIAGGLLIAMPGGIVWVSAGIIAIAIAGYLASRMIPAQEPADPDLRIDWNIIGETGRLMAYLFADRRLKLAAIGVSWFWFVGAIFLAQVPSFAKVLIGADEHVVTLFLTLFSIGIGVGSILAARITGNRVSTTPVPFAAIAMAIFTVDLFFATRAVPPANGVLTLMAFVSEPFAWRIMVDLVGIALSGGLFVVPMFAAIQAWAEPEQRSRVIAAVNIVNAGFMVASAALTLVLQAIGLDIAQIFLVTGIANVAVAIYIARLLPDDLLRGTARTLFTLLYRLEVKDIENLDRAGPRCVVVVNHLSFLDAPLMLSLLHEKPLFAIYSGMAKRWWVKPFLTLVEAMPVDPANPMAVKSLVAKVREGRRLIIFPEGRITVTGALMKVYDGPALIADKADASIVAVRIEGSEQTPFSRLTPSQIRRRWFPKIRVTFMEPRKLELDDDLTPRERRAASGNALYDIMTELAVRTANFDTTIFDAVLTAGERHGMGTIIAEDVLDSSISYRKLIAGSLVLGRKLEAHTVEREHVGVMLPNAVAAIVAFMALQATARVPAMINFTAGAANISAGCGAARVKLIVSSRAFVEQARLQGLVNTLERDFRFLWLEDVRLSIGLGDRLSGLLGAMRPRSIKRRGLAGDAATILFTSGSEGTPKGVVLSHRNLLSNCAQVISRIDVNMQDKVFNILPTFHSFGLLGGVLMPVMNGVPVFMYPSPLHYRIVPEAVYATNSTIMFATDTFLAGYARKAHPYDFRSLRYVFAGAEAVKDETRRLWMEKFGHRILEGYGLTETSPVLALNTPMFNRSGTVGRLLPLIDHRLEPVPGIDEGGKLVVHGPNVMKGYLLADDPGVLKPLEDGWFDTGDIVDISRDGFVTIKGRAKRFAKIAGEMISLSAVEAMVGEVWPDEHHAVVALPDARKGERLVLLTTRENADRRTIQEHGRATGRTELSVPADIITLEKIPLLGSGKTDFTACRKLAEERLGQAVA